MDDMELTRDVLRGAENLLARRPWQLVTSVVMKEDGGWLIGTPLATAVWEHNALPCMPVRAYLKRESEEYIITGLYDAAGCVYQRPPPG